MIKKLVLLGTLFCALIGFQCARAQTAGQTFTVTVTNLTTNIVTTAPSTQVVLRENSANPSAVFSIVLAGSGTALNFPAGATYIFSSQSGQTWPAGTTLGAITATTSGPFTFIATQSVGSPSQQARIGTNTGTGGGFTAGGDLSGTGTSQEVVGILNSPLPALSSGYLHYNGTSFVFDTPAGASAGSQYATQYSSDGLGGFAATSAPVTKGQFYFGYFPNTDAAVAPSVLQAGLGGRTITGATNSDISLFTDNLTVIHHTFSAGASVAIALPTPTTLENSNFAERYCNHSTHADTITPTTWTIQLDLTAAASSAIIPSGICFSLKPDPAGSNWLADTTTSVGYVATQIANAVSGINPAVAVQAATTTILPNTPTYSNGVAGVGATLTAGSNAALVIDGYTVLLNDRVLVQNQASSFQNGVYIETTLGTGAVAYVLTRASDFNQPSDMNSTGAIPVLSGTVNGTTSWVISSKVTTVGTDAVTFAQFSANPTNNVTQASNAASGQICTYTGTNKVCVSSSTLPAGPATSIDPNNTATATGSVNAMVATPTNCPASVSIGAIAHVLANLGNTSTTPTLDWCSTTATIKKGAGGNALIALRPGDYDTALVGLYYWDGTEWILINPIIPPHGVVFACSWGKAGSTSAPTAGTVIASCSKSIPANFFVAGDILTGSLNTEGTTDGSHTGTFDIELALNSTTLFAAGGGSGTSALPCDLMTVSVSQGSADEYRYARIVIGTSGASGSIVQNNCSGFSNGTTAPYTNANGYHTGSGNAQFSDNNLTLTFSTVYTPQVIVNANTATGSTVAFMTADMEIIAP